MSNSSNNRAYTRQYLYHLSEQRGYLLGWTHYLVGSADKVLCHSFHGVPYALPPVGPRRWRKPKALEPCFRYGTRVSPAQCQQGAGMCPQGGVDQSGTTSEDCLQLNIWQPAGEPPLGGFPVLFFIHGGFLQAGSPNSLNCRDLLGQAGLRCIIVCPAYRLGVFGFLATEALSKENSASDATGGNWGFWDQRLALEWTYKNISYFGGDASNISVGGYSAGAHSAFHQLMFDVFKAKSPIVKRVLMLSNSPGPQPKTMREAQAQFDLLCSRADIPFGSSAEQKLACLRQIPAASLVEITSMRASFPLHEFRGCADDSFIPTNMYELIDDGSLAKRMKDRGIEILMGENAVERHVYARWRPPLQDTLEAVKLRLTSDYSAPLVSSLLDTVYAPQGQLPQPRSADVPPPSNWLEAFGTIYADLQVHALQRGLANSLDRHGAGDMVKRYRIEWRAQCSDKLVPRRWGATHVADMAIWFYGMGLGDGLTSDERATVDRWLRPLFAWIEGSVGWSSAEGDDAWAPRNVQAIRCLRRDGAVDICHDEDWQHGLRVWNYAARAAGSFVLDKSPKL